MQGCVRASYRKFDLRKGSFDEGWEYLQKEFVEKNQPLIINVTHVKILDSVNTVLPILCSPMVMKSKSIRSSAG